MPLSKRNKYQPLRTEYTLPVFQSGEKAVLGTLEKSLAMYLTGPTVHCLLTSAGPGNLRLKVHSKYTGDPERDNDRDGAQIVDLTSAKNHFSLRSEQIKQLKTFLTIEITNYGVEVLKVYPLGEPSSSREVDNAVLAKEYEANHYESSWSGVFKKLLREFNYKLAQGVILKPQNYQQYVAYFEIKFQRESYEEVEQQEKDTPVRSNFCLVLEEATVVQPTFPFLLVQTDNGYQIPNETLQLLLRRSCPSLGDEESVEVILHVFLADLPSTDIRYGDISGLSQNVSAADSKEKIKFLTYIKPSKQSRSRARSLRRSPSRSRSSSRQAQVV
jgi:hypothetical protein